jgi:NAD(P)H-flavin reductase
LEIKKRRKMKIISLYPSNDVYQVVDEEDQSVYFQGSEADCKKFIKKFREYERMKAKARQKLYGQTILQRN